MGILNRKKKTEDKTVEEKTVDEVVVKDKKVLNEEIEVNNKKEKTIKTSQAYRILVRPLISEKVTQQQAFGQYTFEVARKANKIEVAKAIKEIYGLTPIKVSMMVMEGKTKRFGRTVGKRKDWKKAIVTLPKGKTISLYEGV